jgi:hypothetical protein
MDVKELRERMAGLEPIGSPSSPRNSWERHRYELRRHAEKDDPTDFLNWSTMTATMFVGEAEFIRDEYDVLRGSDERQRWMDAIIDPCFGNPQRLSYHPMTTGSMVHQAYHLCQWEQATGRRVENLSRIVEFGAGYGAMAVICRHLGFDGDYVILDLPEMSVLQEFYLSNVGVTDAAICPILDGVTHYEPGYCDLLVACWSLSETNTEQRELFLESVNPMSWLIAYQPQWDGLDNVEYFQRLMIEREEYNWTIKNACRGSEYLIGWS